MDGEVLTSRLKTRRKRWRAEQAAAVTGRKRTMAPSPRPSFGRGVFRETVARTSLVPFPRRRSLGDDHRGGATACKTRPALLSFGVQRNRQKQQGRRRGEERGQNGGVLREKERKGLGFGDSVGLKKGRREQVGGDQGWLPWWWCSAPFGAEGTPYSCCLYGGGRRDAGWAWLCGL